MPYAADPLRKLWRSRQYQAFDQALRAGAVPGASMLRQALAARSLGPDMSSLSLAGKVDFFHALVSIACSLESSLSGSPSIAGQIAENKSLHLLAACLCVTSPATGPSTDPRLAQALASIFAKAPECARLGIASTKDSSDGESSCVLTVSNIPLWTLAARLPGAAAEILIAQSMLGGQTLDPAVAWTAFQSALKRGSDPAALLAFARHARAPDAAALQQACSALALSQFSQSVPVPADSAMGALALIEYLCLSHADMEGAACSQAIIGSAAVGGPPHDKDYHLLIPAPFTRVHSFDKADQAPRAARFLDWLEHCALIAARHGMPDIGASRLMNKRLENAYASLEAGIASGHPFPVGFPSLAEAFDSRKASHALRVNGPTPSDASRRRLAL